jgi:DNA-binding transcriptional LysR family regulator
MDKLDQYRIFVQVAEMGSFIKAANALGMPRATVSAAIQQLEEKIAMRLLNRTTRQVHLTVDGTLFLQHVRPLLADADVVERLFQSNHQQAAGQLRIDVPSRIARRLIAPALPSLLRCYPQLQLVLGSADRMVDLVREGVDCAVRVGTLQDSSLVVRPLGFIGLINCASPSYLNEYGLPRTSDDLLKGHLSVGYASPSDGRELPWEYIDSTGKVHDLMIPSRVIVNNAESYIAACLAGVGLIQIPRFDVQHLVERGELIEVIPTQLAPPMPVSILYPHRNQRSRRLVVFMEWLSELMAPHLERTA